MLHACADMLACAPGPPCAFALTPFQPTNTHACTHTCRHLHTNAHIPPTRARLPVYRNRELQQVYEDSSIEVPKPPHWGGFLIRPLAVEFWQGRPSRLHDRLRFSRDDADGSQWRLERLYP